MVIPHVKARIYVERGKKEPHGILLSRPFVNWFPRDTGRKPKGTCVWNVWELHFLLKPAFEASFLAILGFQGLLDSALWPACREVTTYGVWWFCQTPAGPKDLHIVLNIEMLTSWPPANNALLSLFFQFSIIRILFYFSALKNTILNYKWGIWSSYILSVLFLANYVSWLRVLA